jgi:hypothetical protein
MADVPITPFLHKLQEMDPAFCACTAGSERSWRAGAWDLMRCRAVAPWRTRAYSSESAVLAGYHVVTHKRLPSK